MAFSIGSLALSVLVYRETGSTIAAAAYFLSSQVVPALISPAMVVRLDQRDDRPADRRSGLLREGNAVANSVNAIAANTSAPHELCCLRSMGSRRWRS